MQCTSIKSASKTPDSFWNVETCVPAVCRFRTDCRHVQRSLEFSWDEELVSATPNCSSETVYQNTVSYSYTARFPTAVSNTWCSLPQYPAIVGIKMVSKISATGSTPQEHPFLTPTPNNVERVRAAMLQSPQRSARQQALTLRLNKCNIRQNLHKDLYYHPYKIQDAQELSEQDKANWLQFCNEFLDLVKNNSDTANTLLMSDEAHFHVWFCE